MEAMCGSMMAALDVAKSLMLTRDDLRTVLLVSGYRNNDLIDLAEKSTRFMLDIGSGGAALVLRKNAGRNAVLASAFRGDGSFSELCVVPTLGTKAWPPAPGDVARAHFVVPDEETFKARLGERTMPNFYAVIREALRRSGCADDPATGKPDTAIDYLAILHFKRSAHDAVLAELGPAARADHLPRRVWPPRPERPGALARAGPGRGEGARRVDDRVRGRGSRIRVGCHRRVGGARSRDKEPNMRLKDRVCVVTGGARGIGRGIVETLRARGRAARLGSRRERRGVRRRSRRRSPRSGAWWSTSRTPRRSLPPSSGWRPRAAPSTCSSTTRASRRTRCSTRWRTRTGTR